MSRAASHRWIWLAAAGVAVVGGFLCRAKLAAHRSDPTRVLIVALQRGDETTALWALDHGADPHAREAAPAPFDPLRRGHTALYLACRIRSRRLLGELLGCGLDPNERYEADGTPLMQVVALDNTDGAQVLLAHGADVNARAADGSTALHYSCLLPSAGMARLLVAHGASLNLRDRAGETPLGLAKLRRNRVVARYLAQVGGKE